MTKILTNDQARAIAHSLASLAAVGARPARIAVDCGMIRVRCKSDGTVVVLRVGADNRVAAMRVYDGLARFVAQHQEAEA